MLENENLKFKNRRAQQLKTRRWINMREYFITRGLSLCGLFSILTTAMVVFILVKESYAFFQMDGVTFSDFFFQTQWNPLLGSEKHFGVWSLIYGTLLVTGIAMCVALPMGLMTAIYLSQYASPGIRAVLKPLLEVLAGIPTVVFGFFALTTITPFMRDWFFDELGAYNASSAGIAVGIMCLPIVTSLAEDALTNVPKHLSEAAYGLGATRLEVSFKVVLPAALSGVVASFLLAISRAIGETMIVSLAAGSTPEWLFNRDGDIVGMTDSVQTMTGYMVQISMGDSDNFGPEYLSLYAVAMTLFVITFGMTLVGQWIRKRYRQSYD